MVTLLAVLCSLSTTALADVPPSLAAEIARAAAEDKPLVVELHTTWCGPCRHFESVTLADARVQSALRAVHFVRYDAEQSPGKEIEAHLEASGYPTFVVIDRSGSVRLRKSGAAHGEEGIASFVTFLEEAEHATTDEAEIRARLAAAPNDDRTRLKAARWYARRGHLTAALMHYERVRSEDAAAEVARARVTTRLKQQLVADKVAAIRARPVDVSVDDLVTATIGSELYAATVWALFRDVLRAQRDADKLRPLIYVALAAGAKQEALDGARALVAIRPSAESLMALAECLHAFGKTTHAVVTVDQARRLVAYSPYEREIVIDRERIASMGGKSPRVAQLELQAEDLWKRFSKLDQLSPQIGVEKREESGDRRAMMAEMRTFWRRSHELAELIADRCTSAAGSSQRASAIVRLDAAGKIIGSTLLLEVGASTALAACIQFELGNATLPVPKNWPRNEYTLPIQFKPVRV